MAKRDYDAMRTGLEALMAEHATALRPEHALLYNGYHHLMSACNGAGDAEAGARYARLAIACLEKVHHPSRGPWSH
jgi:hypothetical protein